MQHQCPKCSHTFETTEPKAEQCPACGIYFAKYQAHLTGQPIRQPIEKNQVNSPLNLLTSYLLAVPDKVDQTVFWGRAATFGLLLVWGIYFMTLDWHTAEIGYSFMHRVNLVFHEAGHILFIPFGEFMTILGGSLFQWLMPLIVAGTFIIQQRNPFGGAVGLWWCGQSLMDVAPYIGDARALALPLLGEWSEQAAEARAFRHDWHNILARLGWLEQDHFLATLADWLGILAMMTALGWAAWLLYQQYHLKSGDIYDG